MATLKTMTMTKTQLNQMAINQSHLGDVKGRYLLSELLDSLTKHGAVKVNVSLEYNGIYIDSLQVHWLELSNGTRISS